MCCEKRGKNIKNNNDDVVIYAEVDYILLFIFSTLLVTHTLYIYIYIYMCVCVCVCVHKYTYMNYKYVKRIEKS